MGENSHSLKIAKKLNIDRVSRFLLWNKMDENTLMQLDRPIEQKVSFQLGKIPCMAKKIQEFRNYHDWEEMAKFLLTKNTGRSNKKVESQKSQMGWLPIPETEVKTTKR